MNIINDSAFILGKYRILGVKPGKFKVLDSGLWVQEDGDVLSDTGIIKNLIMKDLNKGINIFIQRLTGIKTYDDEITSAEIGTGVTAPAYTDSNLVTPILTGIPRGNQNFSTTTATIQFFMSDLELANGTYKEFLLRCGTQAFARSLITPNYSKSTGQDTVIEYSITLNS